MKSIKKEFLYIIEYYNKQEQYHREDGPARDWKSGTKEWYINGYRHREDGPAIQYYNGEKRWYLNDKRYSEQEYQHELANIKLKRILDL